MDISDRHLHAILDPIRWVAGIDDFAQASAASFGPVFGASKAVFTARRPAAALSPDDVHFVNWPSWCKSHYCEHVRRRDPIRRWLAAVDAQRAGEVARLSDLVPARDLLRTRYYQDMMRPSDARYVMTLAVRHGGTIAGALSLVRSAAAGDFSVPERQLAQTLAPVLGIAYGVAVERGMRGAPPALPSPSIFELPTPARPRPDSATLTPREREVVALVVRGRTNKEIARSFGTSPWTVKNQLRAIFDKVGVHNRTALSALLREA